MQAAGKVTIVKLVIRCPHYDYQYVYVVQTIRALAQAESGDRRIYNFIVIIL